MGGGRTRTTRWVRPPASGAALRGGALRGPVGKIALVLLVCLYA